MENGGNVGMGVPQSTPYTLYTLSSGYLLGPISPFKGSPKKTETPVQMSRSGVQSSVGRGTVPKIQAVGKVPEAKKQASSKNMDVSKNRGAPKSSNLIGCSIIFTIHFGGFFTPIFGSTPKFTEYHRALTEWCIQFL